jgi:hypothetical protein
MNRTQKQMVHCGLTVLLMLWASVSLYGQSYYRYVYYVNSAGELHLLLAPSGSGWTDSREVEIPAPGSKLTMVNSNHATEFFYIAANQHVYELFNQGPGSWFIEDLTSNTGAPAAATGGGFTSFVDTSNSAFITHVFYEGTNGHVYELYCSCNSGGAWHWDDPTSLAGAPVATSGSALTSFIDSTVMHVFYLGTDNHVHELYWTGGTAWHKDDPTSLAGAPVATSGSALTSFVDGSGIMHVLYFSGQNVHELYWNGSWHTDDPTSLAGAPLNVAGSALTSFVNTTGSGDTGMHVMYLGTNEHVYALHSSSTPAWGYFDATAASGGVPAASGSALTSFQGLVGGESGCISLAKTLTYMSCIGQAKGRLRRRT